PDEPDGGLGAGGWETGLQAQKTPRRWLEPRVDAGRPRCYGIGSLAESSQRSELGRKLMDCRIWYTSALIAAILAALLVPSAVAQIVVSANDGKAVLIDGVNKIP